MTAAGAQPALDANVHEYMKVWTGTLGAVVGQIAGSTLAVELTLAAPAEVPPADGQDLLFMVVAGGSLQGEMKLRVPRIAVLSLGQLFLQEAQDAAAEITPDHRDALQELFRQIAGQVATELNERWGQAQLRVEAGTVATWSAASQGWWVTAAGAPCRMLVEWQLSSALVLALQPKAEQKPASEPARTMALPVNKMDLLMDVELEVVLRFGQRTMTLREIMELDAGSIVELDRQVHDPAELLLEGKLIAQGEVVVVDGNYGLRVLEVISSPDKK